LNRRGALFLAEEERERCRHASDLLRPRSPLPRELLRLPELHLMLQTWRWGNTKGNSNNSKRCRSYRSSCADQNSSVKRRRGSVKRQSDEEKRRRGSVRRNNDDEKRQSDDEKRQSDEEKRKSGDGKKQSVNVSVFSFPSLCFLYVCAHTDFLSVSQVSPSPPRRIPLQGDTALCLCLLRVYVRVFVYVLRLVCNFLLSHTLLQRPL